MIQTYVLYYYECQAFIKFVNDITLFNYNGNL